MRRCKAELKWHPRLLILEASAKRVWINTSERIVNLYILLVLLSISDEYQRDIMKLFKSCNTFCTGRPPGAVTIVFMSENDPTEWKAVFTESKEEEVNSLSTRHVSKLIHRNEVAYDSDILEDRIELTVRDIGSSGKFCKARSIVQGHIDRDKGLIYHTSVNIRQQTIHMIVSVLATPRYRL